MFIPPDVYQHRVPIHPLLIDTAKSLLFVKNIEDFPWNRDQSLRALHNLDGKAETWKYWKDKYIKDDSVSSRHCKNIEEKSNFPRQRKNLNETQFLRNTPKRSVSVHFWANLSQFLSSLDAFGCHPFSKVKSVIRPWEPWDFANVDPESSTRWKFGKVIAQGLTLE